MFPARLDAVYDQHNKQGAKRLGDLLAGVLDGMGFSKPLTRFKLEEAWNEAVGSDAVGHTQVVGVRRNVLTVAVDSSVWKQEIGTLRKQHILAQLQEMNTGECIRKLKVQLAQPSDFDGSGL